MSGLTVLISSRSKVTMRIVSSISSVPNDIANSLLTLQPLLATGVGVQPIVNL